MYIYMGVAAGVYTRAHAYIYTQNEEVYGCMCVQKCGQLGKATGYLIRGTLSLSLLRARSLARLYLNESVLPLVLIDIQNRASAILLHA